MVIKGIEYWKHAAEKAESELATALSVIRTDQFKIDAEKEQRTQAERERDEWRKAHDHHEREVEKVTCNLRTMEEKFKALVEEAAGKIKVYENTLREVMDDRSSKA